MDIRVLRYFLAVAREESISRAADALHITQPTLSRQMMMLEDELGVQLFNRTNKITLTEAGVHLKLRAMEIDSLMDMLERDFSAQSDIMGRLAIGSGVYSASNEVFRSLQEFSRQFPKVTYEIHTASADKLKMMMDKGLLDFAIMQEPIDVSRYEYFRLRTKDKWGLLLSASHPLAKNESISVQELNGIELLATGRKAIFNEISYLLGDHARLKIRGYIDLADNALPLVAGSNVGCLAIDGVAEYLNPEHIVFRPFDLDIATNTVLAWKKYGMSFGVASAFLAYIKQAGLRQE
ncbi:LysR family transcriptional regulator [Anaerovibrio sp.]|uniref:LysR family transcriptional regulator n=1 Tax=Anaerovibrio sp. TaxID=1872532 RepID=UPI003F16CE6F